MIETNVFTGLALAERLKQRVKSRAVALGRTPRCNLFLDSGNAGASAYAQRLQGSAAAVGIDMVIREYAETADEMRSQLKEDADAVLTLHPMPGFIDRNEVAELIGPERDVDGQHPLNAGNLALGIAGYRAAATARACILVMREIVGSLKGVNVVVVGASSVVGRPLALMLLEREATVTICHAATVDLAAHTRGADVIVSATGVAGMIRAEHIREGALLLDVGIVRTQKGLVGDVDLESVRGKAALVTHVPDGVGPVTTACLLQNIVEAAEARP